MDTKIRLSGIYERFGRFYIDIFHDVYSNGCIIDSFKYANMPFKTRHDAEMFDWQHWGCDIVK